MTYAERIQDWLADRVSWVQYPHIRPISRNVQKPGFFKNRMPFSTRAALVLFGVATLVASSIVLFFLGLFFWAVITA